MLLSPPAFPPVPWLRLTFDILPAAVPIDNLVLGQPKSALFGALIAFVACHYGLLIKPKTESLGAGPTSSVVSSITVVIVVDAVVAVMFSDVGLL